jgi:putative ABC transport system permease protein
MDALFQDLRYAARTFRRAPGFALLAILTIAVGIGANAAIFSIVNAVLLRPLPYPRADELLLVSQSDRRTKLSLSDATPANFLDWRARNRTFTALAAYESAAMSLTGTDHADPVSGAMVNANFFDVLEVHAALGRTFTASDEEPGAPRVAILSDGLWRRRFGARPEVIGQTARFNDEPVTIVGVMRAGVDYPDKAEMWVPPHWRVPDDPLLGPSRDPSAERDHGYIQVVGRLKPGVTSQAAQRDMDSVSASLEHEYPDDLVNIGVNLVSLRSDLVADVRPTIRLLFAAVVLLLLIATANVSSLLIARATSRHQEIAVRVALGATRRRLLTQLLTESVLLAFAGGAAGVLLAMWMIGPLVALSPADLGVAGDIGVDPTVLLFSFGVSLAAGLFFGMAPARQLSRLDVHRDLKESARGGVGAGQRRVRAALVSAEVALSLVLLVAAALTIRSFILLQHVSTGFEPDNVLTVRVTPPPARYQTHRQLADFYERTVHALHNIAGVQSAGATSRLPLRPGNSARGLTIPGVASNVNTGADYRTVSPDYFRTMGIPLLHGREFTDADREERPLVAVISASLAQRFWPNRDAVGEHFSIDDPAITIVGVVGDVHSAALDAPVHPTVYVPYRQDPFPFMTFVIRSPAPDAISSAVRQAVSQIDSAQPIGDVITMDAQLSNSLSRRRFGVTLLTIFGAIAVTLAAIGLYGVLAFIVAQRKREIGVRMALGATPRSLIADVLREGLRLAGIGVAVGIVLALAATRLLTSMLYGTSATDVATFASVSLLLIVVAVGASFVPALRASRVDPLVALRED